MYPSKDKKYLGIFVKNQYEELQRIKRENHVIDIFYLQGLHTSKVGTAIKYLKAIKFTPYLFKKYDTVHLHYFYPLIILVWFYKIIHPTTKLVVTFHGSDINTQVNDKNQALFKYFAKKIDFNIPVGKIVAKNVKEKLNLPIGKILPVGIAKRTFYPMENVAKKYDFIFVGSFLPAKGVETLIETIKTLPKATSFCLVGKGAQYEEIFKNLQTEGYAIEIKIDLSQEELRLLYNQSKYLFLPSKSEGFSSVTMEAMYCGVPVITSNIKQFKEQVVPGKNGFMLDTNNVANLSEKMLQLKDLDFVSYTKLVVGATNSLQHLSLNNVCKELLKIYKE
jgi:L-malate glycosyltransferase